MTDEQMFKMDEMLVAVLKTQKDAKSSAKLTKQVASGGLKSNESEVFEMHFI